MIYVDDARIYARGKNWYHLMSDTDGDEIHRFARKIGLKRHWFHKDHYDVTLPMKIRAIQAGAEPCTVMDLVQIRKNKRSAH